MKNAVEIMPGKLIRVRYLGPTAHRGVRWSVQANEFPVRIYRRQAFADDDLIDAGLAARKYAETVIDIRVRSITYVGSMGSDRYFKVKGAR